MKCGLEASFNSKGMDRFKDQGRKIQGIIGFKYSGLGLYQFGDTAKEDGSEEEIEEIIKNAYVPDFSDEETTNADASPAPASPGLKVLGKIELPEAHK